MGYHAEDALLDDLCSLLLPSERTAGPTAACTGSTGSWLGSCLGNWTARLNAARRVRSRIWARYRSARTSAPGSSDTTICPGNDDKINIKIKRNTYNI